MPDANENVEPTNPNPEGLPDTAGDLQSRLDLVRSQYAARDQLVLLCNEMYQMIRSRRSTYLGSDSATWRKLVAPEYWCSSERPQNAIDVAVAILSGYPPQYRVTIPGGGNDALTARAEKFLAGIWRANSRRQNADLYRRACMRLVCDGAVGVRVLWDPNAPLGVVNTMKPPTEETADEEWAVVTYPHNRIPLAIDIIPWNKLYPIGPKTFTSPFSELIFTENRTYGSIVREWGGIEGVTVPPPPTTPAEVKNPTPSNDREAPYIEWWGYDLEGRVHYMVVFDNHVVVSRREIGYPCIPFVIGTFKEADAENPTFSHLPFIFPILWLTEREEYMRSRIFKIVDMIAGMLPVHRGPTPVALEGGWGKIINLTEDRERIEFPDFPGNPPDVWKVLEDIDQGQSQGTFSAAMFGQASSRLSGYGLAQLIGADTLRMDTPRANMELLHSAVSDVIFQILQTFTPEVHMAVTTQVKGKTLAAMLSGSETMSLVVDTFMKPRQASDEQRLAVIGSQLASLPKPPVSMQYILEHYFGIAQPEDEMQRVLSEEAMRDPMVRMIALVESLAEIGSPYAGIVAARLGEVLAKQAGGQAGTQGADQTMPGMGMGMPQAVGGNPPIEQLGGGVTGETQMDSQEVARMGSPNVGE